MSDQSPFDRVLAHRQFSAEAFNTAWDLIDKTDRTPEEDIAMLCRAAASLWHWNQRSDMNSQSRSVGYWQLSRVFALLSEGGMAMRCGELCLKYSKGTPPFYEAYAYEALARASVISGDSAAAIRYLAAAQKLVDRIEEPSSREMIMADLQSIRA
ncbi:hypothetical protein C5Y96_00985 [Blastopirellula marina]|uniref:Uncharacterized protein n=1 Tax=Blastopirellula marina TaxID=124 RepID=A0A2S8G8K4_9BACT|nr:MULTISPECIES: hypothetical protein [Pirellulaceae]PQO40778.1 hypothetical protein C5Y96_00985 [Blastopirellula marina]RCS56105.1 hypothetical protein DTL36_00985 [Bremerella cremea]